jgi:predicted dehydrogenase
MVQIGTGGHGLDWCGRILPPFVRAGRIEVVAAVDVDETALGNATRFLGLPPERCYTDLRTALEQVEADFCAVVVPPEAHEEVVGIALEFGLDVLCEKPLADSFESCFRIEHAVAAAGRRLGVTMSHRFDQDKTTLRRELRSGRHGALDYLVYRFTCDYRCFPTFGASRYALEHPLMLDAGAHHLDIVADLVASPCKTVFAEAWTPEWADFEGASQALVTMRFENGVRALYEGALSNAADLNSWADDYIRAECEQSTLVLSQRRLERFPYVPGRPRGQVREGGGDEIEQDPDDRWVHNRLIDHFLAWLDDGPPMETHCAANVENAALLFAAIESARRGTPVEVARFAAEERDRVDRMLRPTSLASRRARGSGVSADGSEAAAER